MTEAGRKSQGRLYSSDLIWNVTKLELKLDAWGDMHSQILDIPLVLFLASLIVQPCEYEYLYASTCDRNGFLFIVCSCAFRLYMTKTWMKTKVFVRSGLPPVKNTQYLCIKLLPTLNYLNTTWVRNFSSIRAFSHNPFQGGCPPWF